MPQSFSLIGFGFVWHIAEMFRLHFGKPYADITVDAHAINSQGDLSRELGWYVGQARLPREPCCEELVQDWGLFGEMSSGAFYLDFRFFFCNHSTCIEMRCHE